MMLSLILYGISLLNGWSMRPPLSGQTILAFRCMYYPKGLIFILTLERTLLTIYYRPSCPYYGTIQHSEHHTRTTEMLLIERIHHSNSKTEKQEQATKSAQLIAFQCVMNSSTMESSGAKNTRTRMRSSSYARTSAGRYCRAPGSSSSLVGRNDVCIE